MLSGPLVGEVQQSDVSWLRSWRATGNKSVVILPDARGPNNVILMSKLESDLTQVQCWSCIRRVLLARNCVWVGPFIGVVL